MSRKTKIMVTLGLVVLLVLTTIGTTLAQEPPKVLGIKKVFTRVAEILGIEEQKLIDAFTQARKELAAEAFQPRLDKLVEQGRLTEEQANQIREWWEKRPESLGPGLGMMKPGPGLDRGLKWGKGRFPWSPKPPRAPAP